MIVATVGHVDHGKTTLVRALTGIDTDRLPEEKARGMSIDLGFACRRGAAGARTSFVDVPGHERFVRNMLAGVCGIDLALIVVAADDGVMPQTREHLAVLDLLGVARGAIVVTKADRAGASRAAQVADAVHALLAGSALGTAPAFIVDALHGQGLDALARWLDGEAGRNGPATAATQPPGPPAPMRLAIDRAFTVNGSGTVVTGTLFDGAVTVGDTLVVSPGGQTVRVRRIQVHDAAVEHAAAGQRCALNLVGIDLAQVARGQWVLSPGLHRPTALLDARVRVLADGGHGLQHHQALHLHLGTQAVPARLLVPQAGVVAAGGTSFARLRLDAAIGALHGDRFIVRDPATRRVVGGGVVLDPFAADRRGTPADRLVRLRAFDRGAAVPVLRALSACDPGLVELDAFATAFKLEADALQAALDAADLVRLPAATELAMARGRADELAGTIAVRLAAHHRDHPDCAGETIGRLRQAVAPALAPAGFRALLDTLVDAGRVHITGTTVRLTGHVAAEAPAERALWRRLQPKLHRHGPAPLHLAELARRLDVDPSRLRALAQRKVGQGALLRVGDDRYVLRETLAALARTATDLVSASGDQGFTVAQFRDAIGSGRGLAVELLECLDRQRVTVRSGERRRLLDGGPGVPVDPTAVDQRRRQHWRHRHRFQPTGAPP